MVGYVSIIFSVIVFVLYLYFKWSYTYWKRRNIPYMEPKIPFGTTANPFKPKNFLGYQIKKVYDVFKALKYKHVGLYAYTSPFYFVIDLDYIKRILAQDFSYFTDRGDNSVEKYDILANHLGNLDGMQWRILRKKLTPTFTMSKMKIMFLTVVKCAKQMEEAVGKICENGQPLDAKYLTTSYTLDVTGFCGFGIECNSFINRDEEFHAHLRAPLVQNSTKWFTKILIKVLGVNLARFFDFTLKSKQTTTFFLNLVKNTVQYRKENSVICKDFLQILIDLQDDKVHLSIEEMVANAYMFFTAGYHTSSMTMTFCLYQLAKNPVIQQQLREEILNCLQKHGEVTFDAIEEMAYLTQVIFETMRMYPPFYAITRLCVKDYPVPDTNGIIEKGTLIIIPIFGLHYDKEHYPNPDQFNPDRFQKENFEKIAPFSYLPFGEGPRMCIGLRFAMMQIKVGLVTLMKKYTFSLNEKTDVPVQLDENEKLTTPKSKILLNVHLN